MARYLYAASPADYVVDGSTGLPVPGAVVTVWTARTGGSQVTDLQTVGGSPITQVTADSAGFLAFYGPDGLTDNLWLYSGSGSRLVVRAVVNPTVAGTALPLAGGTLTGNLTLAGGPSADLHAATKKYVDDNVANFVDVTGDTMSGSLRVNQASLKVSGDASTYVFARRQGDGTGYGFHLGATSTLPLSASLYDSGGNTLTAALNYSTSTTRWNITGNTYIDGTLTMNSKKISGLAAASANGDAVRYEQVVATYAIGNRPVGTTQSLAQYATATLTYSSEDDPSSLLSSGVFTAPAAGLYQVSGWYGFVTSNGVFGRGSLVWNSTDVAQADTSKYDGTQVASLSALVQMAASDTVKLTVWNIGSVDATVGIYGRLGVFRIGI